MTRSDVATVLSAVTVMLGLTLPAQAFDKISIPSRDGFSLTGWLALPGRPGPAPVVIGLHGCAGLYSRSGDIGAREKDWSQRLNTAGIAVLLLDSFGPRGIESLCNDRKRALTPAGRARDAFAALDWLTSRDLPIGDASASSAGPMAARPRCASPETSGREA